MTNSTPYIAAIVHDDGTIESLGRFASYDEAQKRHAKDWMRESFIDPQLGGKSGRTSVLLDYGAIEPGQVTAERLVASDPILYDVFRMGRDYSANEQHKSESDAESYAAAVKMAMHMPPIPESVSAELYKDLGDE